MGLRTDAATIALKCNSVLFVPPPDQIFVPTKLIITPIYPAEIRYEGAALPCPDFGNINNSDATGFEITVEFL